MLYVIYLDHLPITCTYTMSVGSPVKWVFILTGERNTWGSDRLFVGIRHPSYSFFEGLYEGELTKEVCDSSFKFIYVLQNFRRLDFNHNLLYCTSFLHVLSMHVHVLNLLNRIHTCILCIFLYTVYVIFLGCTNRP